MTDMFGTGLPSDCGAVTVVCDVACVLMAVAWPLMGDCCTPFDNNPGMSRLHHVPSPNTLSIFQMFLTGWSDRIFN